MVGEFVGNPQATTGGGLEILGFTVAPVAVFLLVRGICRGLWELSEPLRDRIAEKREEEQRCRAKR
jgi:hypothetical protein